MRDELDTRFLDEWLHDTEVTPPDPHVAARRVASRLAETTQVGRRWWLPAFHANATAPTATDTTAYQPSPFPAMNGHTPTVIGRTHSMFSPAKAITVGALAFVVGSVVFIAQPLGQQGGSVPGAATDTGSVNPVWVTGTKSLGPACADATTSTDDGTVLRIRGSHCDQQTWETSDPRLTGDVTARWNADVYRRDDGAETTTLAAGTYDLRNDGGDWHCQYADALKGSPSEASDGINDETVTCAGGDGYDGLTAVLFLRWTGNSTAIEGLVFEGEVPPLPETAAE